MKSERSERQRGRQASEEERSDGGEEIPPSRPVLSLVKGFEAEPSALVKGFEAEPSASGG